MDSATCNVIYVDRNVRNATLLNTDSTTLDLETTLGESLQLRGNLALLIDAFRDEVAVTEGEARHILAQFLFYGYDVFKKVKDLSGGEKMRLRLAQLMQQKVNLLLLDEPTNHLDIESREVLEETLENFDGTVIAVSHDRYFLEKLFFFKFSNQLSLTL